MPDVLSGVEMGHAQDLVWISTALDEALAALEEFTPGAIESTLKSGGDPLTEADLAVDRVLRTILPAEDEGWLSEETIDSLDRLSRRRVWIVDPIDGTREFIDGIPEWCVSIGLIEDGQPVAGGIHNPATGERVMGAVGCGVEYAGPHGALGASTLVEARVGASRSEVMRGEWDGYGASGFAIVPMGSVAYKLALVASGRLDATWTRSPKNEWDIAGGAALLAASGGWAALIDGSTPTWNNRDTLVPGFIATTPSLRDEVSALLL
ncbi:MAG: 3'(2'),5'-bisphosphate nucleotidase CysQ [Actinomycetia bacterium]|nr:3'(2'),5'-bisphosphate nucleotidase CysQ [Actinomycetes bacterium]